MADGDVDLEPILRQAVDMALPAVALGEYRYGIGQSRNRTRYERWLAELIASCRVLPVDEATSEVYAEIRSELKRDGRPIPGNDLWIQLWRGSTGCRCLAGTGISTMLRDSTGSAGKPRGCFPISKPWENRRPKAYSTRVYQRDDSRRPPSTTRVCPVIKDERPLASSNATSAISIGWPKWRMGWLLMCRSR